MDNLLSVLLNLLLDVLIIGVVFNVLGIGLNETSFVDLTGHFHQLFSDAGHFPSVMQQLNHDLNSVSGNLFLP